MVPERERERLYKVRHLNSLNGKVEIRRELSLISLASGKTELEGETFFKMLPLKPGGLMYP